MSLRGERLNEPSHPAENGGHCRPALDPFPPSPEADLSVPRDMPRWGKRARAPVGWHRERGNQSDWPGRAAIPCTKSLDTRENRGIAIRHAWLRQGSGTEGVAGGQVVWGASESPRTDWGTSSRVRCGAQPPAQHLELGSTSLTEMSPVSGRRWQGECTEHRWES